MLLWESNEEVILLKKQIATTFHKRFAMTDIMEQQLNNPLHGIKLEQIINELEAHYGWEYLGYTINIRCFTHDPSVKSSLKFLRRTPWARTKVEQMYLNMLKKRT